MFSQRIGAGCGVDEDGDEASALITVTNARNIATSLPKGRPRSASTRARRWCTPSPHSGVPPPLTVVYPLPPSLTVVSPPQVVALLAGLWLSEGWRRALVFWRLVGVMVVH